MHKIISYYTHLERPKPPILGILVMPNQQRGGISINKNVYLEICCTLYKILPPTNLIHV
jgi:hypothetical protein